MQQLGFRPGLSAGLVVLCLLCKSKAVGNNLKCHQETFEAREKSWHIKMTESDTAVIIKKLLYRNMPVFCKYNADQN